MLKLGAVSGLVLAAATASALAAPITSAPASSLALRSDVQQVPEFGMRVRLRAGDELGEFLQRLTGAQGREGFGDQREQVFVKLIGSICR